MKRRLATNIDGYLFKLLFLSELAYFDGADSILSCSNANEVSGQDFTILAPVFQERLRLHGAIYLPDSFVLMLRYCILTEIRNEFLDLIG